MTNLAIVEAASEGVSLLDHAIDAAASSLVAAQKKDGHWLYELEADATIPAEYILLQHYLDEVDPTEEARIAAFLRASQGEHGGWPLWYGGDLDMSASVKAYFALKAAGDSADAPHMARARAAILARGGAARTNVFTRIQLALFGQVPWRAVPKMPVEIMLLPKWFPFHLDKVSYWSRTVIAPLLVVMAKQPQARNPRGVDIGEIFSIPPAEETDWAGSTNDTLWGRFFNTVDKALHWAEPFFPEGTREKAIKEAVAFVEERLNGEDGLGGIYPAIANTVMMYDCLGYSAGHPNLLIAKKAVRKLLVLEGDRIYCQPCLSPVWDTGLACHALSEAGGEVAEAAVKRGLDWLVGRQILDVVGDWGSNRPGLRPGGWAFQYENPYYPDVDDTAVVALAMERHDKSRYAHAIERATEWIFGMQSSNGGWGAFDADNEYHYLNHIPFADHGALLDPPTADVSARCLSLLAKLGYGTENKTIREGINYLLKEQEADGSWFGRWGTNYIYGTWSALCALNMAGFDRNSSEIRRAAEWLLSHQREDGGWGESEESYYPGKPHGEFEVSTASQTAWALLGLMAAGEVESPAVERGINFLLANQQTHGLWDEDWFTSVGFPRVFYLRYHGYRAYFPLWALARYRNLRRDGQVRVTQGL